MKKGLMSIEPVGSEADKGSDSTHGGSPGRARAGWHIATVAVAAAGAWVAAHFILQIPRGWPHYTSGEWDVLLVARSIEAGAPPEMVVGSIHGFQPGSWLVGGVVALLLLCGVPLLIAAKAVMMTVGAATVALCAGTASSLCKRPEGALVAGGVVGLAMAICWPSWHHELSGLSGATPESVPFQLAALFLAFFRPWGPIRSSVSAGFALAVAWLLSPVTLWTIPLTLLALSKPRESGGRGARATLIRIGSALGTVAFGLGTVALLLPGGITGISAFLSWNWAQLAPAGGVVGPGGFTALFDTILAAPSTLLVVPERAPTAARAAVMVFGCTLVLTPLVALWWVIRTRHMGGPAVIALAGATWFLPLSRVFQGEPGSVSRYYMVPLLLELIALAVVLGHLVERFPARGRAVATGVGLVLLVPIFTPSYWTSLPPASPDSLQESLITTGAHSIAVPWLPVAPAGHAPTRRQQLIDPTRLLTLLPFAPDKGRVALVQGFGMDVGSDAHSADIVGSTAWLIPGLMGLKASLRPDEVAGLLVGAGCGLSANQPLVIERAGLKGASLIDAELAAYGMGLCAQEAELRFGCSLWGAIDELARRPGTLAAFVAGLKATDFPHERVSEAPDLLQAPLIDLFKTADKTNPPPGGPPGRPLLNYLPPRPNMGCSDAKTYEVKVPQVCPEVETGPGRLVGTITREAPLHQDGVGTLFLALFDGNPFTGDGACEVARMTVTEVDIGSEGWTYNYALSGIPTRREPYFVVTLFDDGNNQDPTGELWPNPDHLADLRGVDLSWPSVVVQDSASVALDVNLSSRYGR